MVKEAHLKVMDSLPTSNRVDSDTLTLRRSQNQVGNLNVVGLCSHVNLGDAFQEIADVYYLAGGHPLEAVVCGADWAKLDALGLAQNRQNFRRTISYRFVALVASTDQLSETRLL